MGFPCRGLGAGGGFFVESPEATDLRVVVDSASSSSCDVRGLSAAIGGIGSKIDWRDIDAESAVLLLSLILGGPVATTLDGPEVSCELPSPPVSSNRVNASTSIVCLLVSCFEASAAL